MQKIWNKNNVEDLLEFVSSIKGSKKIVEDLRIALKARIALEEKQAKSAGQIEYSKKVKVWVDKIQNNYKQIEEYSAEIKKINEEVMKTEDHKRYLIEAEGVEKLYQRVYTPENLKVLKSALNDQSDKVQGLAAFVDEIERVINVQDIPNNPNGMDQVSKTKSK